MKSDLKIEKPCFESWENMKMGLNSRHCEVCSKNVIDFTNKTRKQIIEEMLLSKTSSVCGRVYPHQIDFTAKEILVTIRGFRTKKVQTNLSFYFLSLSTSLLMSCSDYYSDKIITNGIEQNDSDSTADKELPPPPLRVSDSSPLLGEMILRTEIDENNVYTNPEVMPEFKGGIDSLMTYLSKNIVYPKWENKMKIQGRVYASFVVGKNGSVKDVRIIRSVKDSKNFDSEVIRVLTNMPNWIPGKHENKNVDSKFTLPIEFKLS